MDKKAASTELYVPVRLDLPEGGKVEFDIRDDFVEQTKSAIEKIIAIYKKNKNQVKEQLKSNPFNDQVTFLEKKIYAQLPDIDADERNSVLYIYIIYWLSLKVETKYNFALQPMEENEVLKRKDRLKKFIDHNLEPQAGPLKLKDCIAYALSWIIVSDTNQESDQLSAGLPYQELIKKFPLAKKKMAVPNAFPKGVGVVPNNPVVAAGLRAIFKGGPNARKLIGGWAQLEGQVFYRQIHKSGRGQIRYYPDMLPKGPDMQINVDSLWDFVERLNPFTADVALAILAQLCEPSAGIRPKFPLRESVMINADAILRYKGIRKYGKDRRIMEKRIHEEVERLRTLHFDLERYPFPWNKKGTKYSGDRLFDIVRVETYQLKLFDKEEVIETAWSVRAGQWAEHFFNTEQERVWTSRMAKVLIELDYRNQRKTAQLSKKMGYLLLTAPGGTAHRNRPVMRRIDRILEEIGELPAPEFRTKDWAGRLRDRLLQAWDILLSAGLIKKLKFPDGYGFDDTDRSKGWVETWLSSKVIITAPEAAPEPTQKEIEAFRRKQLPRNKKAKRPISKKIRRKPQAIQLEVCSPKYRKKIRNACEEQYISQRTLAKILAIAPSTLSNILRGHDLPSLELAQKIDSWLESEESSNIDTAQL